MSKYFDEVKQIILNNLDIDDEAKITMEATFDGDLGADSIARFEIVNEMEDRYSVEVDDETAQSLTTVGAVCKFLEEAVG
ncbi:MAG: acyl carrier protein [Calditrichaeota bacterium]|nr:acyl carrier protein [Candidatus Cloacimonadota bacterium]MCA9786683.1 acyl carrier protein [Candidatus Cloacimonadota bacterium]MCB1046995.1 acyl carrier protein [Calditrichota bacterium]MCB9473335.1 acyl carrier protein [Candidatus Delongbacteria bacterium]